MTGQNHPSRRQIRRRWGTCPDCQVDVAIECRPQRSAPLPTEDEWAVPIQQCPVCGSTRIWLERTSSEGAAEEKTQLQVRLQGEPDRPEAPWVLTVEGRVGPQLLQMLSGRATQLVLASDEDLAAVAVGTVVRAADGTIAARYDQERGVVFGDERPFPWSALRAPAVVLWSMQAEQGMPS